VRREEPCSQETILLAVSRGLGGRCRFLLLRGRLAREPRWQTRQLASRECSRATEPASQTCPKRSGRTLAAGLGGIGARPSTAALAAAATAAGRNSECRSLSSSLTRCRRVLLQYDFRRRRIPSGQGRSYE
jgi:Mrp family chromosome partitioning ATPase